MESFPHVVWFGGWIIYNVASSHPFDKCPFGLLTLIVSLEAIFFRRRSADAGPAGLAPFQAGRPVSVTVR